MKSFHSRWYYDGRDLEVYWPLEVNHIEPRKGAGYGPGCHHHLDGLETLCHACHLEVTAAQLAEWRQVSPRQPVGGSNPIRPSEELPMPLWGTE